MANEGISPELQQQIAQLQQFNSQMQAAQQQRMQLEMMQNENEQALEALGTLAADAKVFRNVGSLLVQDDKEAAHARIAEEQETLEIRVKRAKQQEEQIREAATQLQQKLQSALGQ